MMQRITHNLPMAVRCIYRFDWANSSYAVHDADKTAHDADSWIHVDHPQVA
jgi:hypothetical protein